MRRKTPVYRRPARQVCLNASCLQVARAYESHYGVKIDDKMTFQEAACKMARDMGGPESAAFIMSQSNDPNIDD